MKQLLSLLCFIAIVLTSQAQDKNFDLSKYKFPDYKRHEMEFSFNSNGNSYSSYMKEPVTANQSGYLIDNSTSSFNSKIQVNYQFNHFTRKRIDMFSSALNGQYEFYKSENENSYSKNNTPQIWGHVSATRRNYITEDKLFLEGSTYMSFYASRTNQFYQNQAKSTRKSNSLTVNGAFGIGTGRIEYVQDLWKGYYILEKLKQNQSIRQDLSENDIFEFSKLISKLSNKRFFDLRLRRIAELQSLDSMLHEQNLIVNNDISYFTTLNDYWSFPIYFERRTGKELKLKVSPQFTRYYNKSDLTPSSSPAYIQLISSASYSWAKQINLFWERNLDVDFSNKTLIFKNSYVEKNTQKNLIETTASFGYAFYPDTRTKIRLNGQYYGYEFSYYSGEEMIKGWRNNFRLNFEIAYYISPQLQISGNISDNLSSSTLHSEKRNELNYNLGLRYAIF